MKVPEILIKKSINLPILGLGTWSLKGPTCSSVVKMALEIGYRHFDTAHMYENHKEIGTGIKGFDREKLFLTSKFVLPQLENESVEATCDRALLEIDTDYLDLYLIHYPIRSIDMVKVYEEMQRLVAKKKVRAIGVSNFTTRHLQDLLDQGFIPDVNQVEFHPYLNQIELLSFCLQNKIHIMSYRSLGKGTLITDPLFENIGKQYGKTPAQVCLRWLVEKEISIIPKASNKKHLEENFQIFDFSLNEKDRKILDNLELQHRFCEREWSDFEYV